MQDERVPPELFEEAVYDHFYRESLEERADADVQLIAELAGLRPGADVLDVPCGDGRVAVRLAGLGCRVVGLDRSPRFVSAARSRAGGDRARFEVADMRDLGYDAGFDAVINWFTSFGYFDAVANRALLRAFRRALRPGGRLVLEQHNPEVVRRAVQAGGGTFAHVIERGDDLLVDRLRVHGDVCEVERYVVRDGRTRRLGFSLELFDRDRLTAALGQAGFRDVRLLDERGEAAGAGSRRLVAVAVAP